MDITIAKYAGACYGVNRSLDIVLNEAKTRKKTGTLGDLIHNPEVVDKLSKDYHVVSCKDLNDAHDNNIQTLIIRSHGVDIKIHERAISDGFYVVDATCPHVKQVQHAASQLAEKYGCVLVIGKEKHPEVEGVVSYVFEKESKCFVVQNVLDLEKIIKQLKKFENGIGVVSQTTQSVETFNNIVEYLQNNDINCDVKNTICSATSFRQKSALELSKKVDGFIVIGGKNSSNTTHLYDICKKNCNKTFHIEKWEELDTAEISQCRNIGITAGASTPKSQIDYIVSKLRLL